MTDYTKLVEALRCREYKPECGSSDCPYWSGLGCMDGQLMEDAADAIEALQAQLPKRGKWIKHEDDACECSVCGLGLESFVEGIFYNFCPFCGADMRAKMEAQDDKA